MAWDLLPVGGDDHHVCVLKRLGLVLAHLPDLLLEAGLGGDDVELDDVPLHLDRVAHLLVLLANPLHHGLVVVTHLDDVGSETALLQAAGALLTGASWTRPVALKDTEKKLGQGYFLEECKTNNIKIEYAASPKGQIYFS